MAVEIVKRYRSQVREVVLGATKEEGGTRQNDQGRRPNGITFLISKEKTPILDAMEVWDIVPEEWPDNLKSYFEDVYEILLPGQKV